MKNKNHRDGIQLLLARAESKLHFLKPFCSMHWEPYRNAWVPSYISRVIQKLEEKLGEDDTGQVETMIAEYRECLDLYNRQFIY